MFAIFCNPRLKLSGLLNCPTKLLFCHDNDIVGVELLLFYCRGAPGQFGHAVVFVVFCEQQAGCSACDSPGATLCTFMSDASSRRRPFVLAPVHVWAIFLIVSWAYTQG